MRNPPKTRHQFTAEQKAEAVELCLQEDLSCNAIAQRLGLPPGTWLDGFVRPARIDRWQAGLHDPGMVTSEERAELNRLRQENRELRREKDCFRLAAAHDGLRPTGLLRVSARSSCPRKISPDRSAC